MPNTTILSSAVNQNFTDIATGLSDCLTRDGQAGMTAALGLISGTSSAPGIGFNSDATSGMYLPASGSVGLVAKGAIGLKVSGQTYGAISASISAGGSGYAVGDTIYITGGTNSVVAAFTVATLSGSAVATVTMTVPGIYTVKPTNPAAQGSTSGSGTGCTLTVTYNDLSALVYNLGITDLANALLWTKLGASSFVSGLMGQANGFDFATAIGSTNIKNAIGVSPSPQASFKNLTVKVATNTTVAITADAVVLKNSGSLYFLATSVSLSCNLGTTGANALDTGVIAVNSFYNMFVIYNGTTTSSLASLSATAPTLPTGYTYFARVGAVQTINGSATLYGTWQFGRDVQYVVGLAQTAVIPNIANGSVGSFSVTSPTLAAASVVRFVPPTASAIKVLFFNAWKAGTPANMLVAPSTAWGGTNNGPQGSAGNVWPCYSANQTVGTVIEFILESTSIAWCSDNTGGAISCLGWTDNI